MQDLCSCTLADAQQTHSRGSGRSMLPCHMRTVGPLSEIPSPYKRESQTASSAVSLQAYMLEPVLLLLPACAASYSAARRDMMAVLSTTTSPSIFTTGTCHQGKIRCSANHHEPWGHNHHLLRSDAYKAVVQQASDSYLIRAAAGTLACAPSCIQTTSAQTWSAG